jgi:FkbM family methyltransferase
MTFLALVKDGDTVLDIGANSGAYTLLFSDIVGPPGSVHAFEPVPPTFRLLGDRLAGDGRFSNVILNNFALGDSPGWFEMHVPAGDFGQASLKKHAAGSWSKSEREVYTCEVRRLDDYLGQAPLARVDFIKFDVEGAELPALRGATRLLDQFHPVLHLEYSADWTRDFGYNLRDLVTFLRAHGYVHFYGNDASLCEADLETLTASGGSLNLICATAPLVSRDLQPFSRL